MRGFSHLLTSLGFESLLGNTSWFSQSLMRNQTTAIAFAQVGLEGKAARLNWLLTLEGDGHNLLPILIDNLSLQSALRGASCLLGAAFADDDLFITLRQSGFCRYGWQRLWHLERDRFPAPDTSAFQFSWMRPQATDHTEIDALYRRLVSPSVRTIRKISGASSPQYILKTAEGISGMAEVNTYGNKVCVKPLLAQSDFSAQALLQSLFARFFATHPTAYLLQTSDQAWLDDVLYELGEPIFEREELLVKHFTSLQKTSIHVLNHATQNRHVDTIAPLVKMRDMQDNL